MTKPKKLRTPDDVRRALAEIAGRMLRGEITAQQAAASTNVLKALAHEMRCAEER
jgi:hypothetical protein